MKRRLFLAQSGGLLAFPGLPGCTVNNLGLTAKPDSAREFETGVRQIEAESGGRLGVAVIDTHTGARFSWRGDERFPLTSTFKPMAAALVLSRVDKGLESLQRRVVFHMPEVVTYSPVTQPRVGGAGMTLAELCEATITLSDNTAGNLLLKSFGGPQALTAYFRTLGDKLSRLDRFETELNEARPGDSRDTTTPHAMLANLQHVVLGDALSPASREQMTTWLLANKTGDQRLRAGFSGGWRVADKTGAGANGTNNHVAVVWPPGRAPLVVACYLTGSTVESAQRDAAIANVARVVVRSV